MIDSSKSCGSRKTIPDRNVEVELPAIKQTKRTSRLIRRQVAPRFEVGLHTPPRMASSFGATGTVYCLLIHPPVVRSCHMNTIFERLYRLLGRTTVGLLLAGLGFFGLALLSALLGFSPGAASFSDVAASIAYVFGALFSLFLMMSLVSAVIRRLDRRSQIKSQGAKP